MTETELRERLMQEAGQFKSALDTYCAALAERAPYIEEHIATIYDVAGRPYGDTPEDAWQWYCEAAVVYHLRRATDRSEAQHGVLREARSLTRVTAP